MVGTLVSGVGHLFKSPHPRPAGRLLEKSWRLRSPGQIRKGLVRLAELRPSRVGLPRLLSGPECGQYAFGIFRWPLCRPRREVDVELLRELRAKGYGYKRIAGEYTRLTGEYISHTTVRDRLVGD